MALDSTELIYKTFFLAFIKRVLLKAEIEIPDKLFHI